MKKFISMLLCTALCIVFLSSCDSKNEKPNNVNIFMPLSSEAFSSDDKKLTEELYNYVTSLKYEKIDEKQKNDEFDFLSQLKIKFAFGSKPILDFFIEKSGILWIQNYKNGVLIESDNEPEIQYYKVTGDFDYDYIFNIYNEPLNKTFSLKDLPSGKLNWEDYDFPFLKPPADFFEIDKRYNDPLLCRGITDEKKEIYFSQLISDGWEKVSENNLYYYIFIKENEYLSISRQGSYGSDYYVIGYDAGYKGEERFGAISKVKAIDYINVCYDEYKSAHPDIPFSDAKIKTVREACIKNLFEKTGMQLFEAFWELGETSYFLVKNETAFMLSRGFSVVNNFPLYVYDIDGDGEFEVISSYNSGSGISYFTVSAIKFGNPAEFSSLTETIHVAYSNTWMEGAPCLTLKQNKNGYVHLWGIVYDEENGYIIDKNKDYGRLTVAGDKIVPQKNDLLEKDLNQRYE